MPYPRSLLQIDFDQFHRYAATAVLLKPLLASLARTHHDPVRILEVGCFTLNLLPEFLAPLPVEIVRADVVAGLGDGTGPYVELTRGERYPFQDSSFEYVVALEVLEHIPSEERPHAIGEWARLAREAVVFSCPAGNRVRSVERRAHADYRGRHAGADHPWLEEHDRFGRPTFREVRRLCDSHGLTCRRFRNSPLAEWLPLLLSTERVWEAGPNDLVRRFNELLNRRAFRAFIRGPAYRSVFVAFKSPAQASHASGIWEDSSAIAAKEPIDPVRLLSRTFTRLLTANEKRRVDGRRLALLERERLELHQRLDESQRQGVWQTRELSQWRRRAGRWAAVWRSWQRRWGFHRVAIPADAERTQLTTDGPNRWVAVGDRPSLSWTCRLARGWHRIALRGQADAGRRAHITFAADQGWSCTVNLGRWPKASAGWGTFVYLHHPIQHARFEPVDGPAQLSLDHFAITPVSAARAAFAGLRRWLVSLCRQPLRTLRAGKGRSFPRYCHELATRPRGSLFQSRDPFEDWLASQRPTLHARRDAIQRLQTIAPNASIAVFLSPSPDTGPDELERTLASLARQDECRLEIWIAAPEGGHIDLHQLQTCRGLRDKIRFLPHEPITPCSRLLHRCGQETASTLVLPLPVGATLEADALVQFLLHADEHPGSVMLYADETFRDPGGKPRVVLKPDPSPETLRHQPQLCGVVAIRSDYLRRQGVHPTFEGALVPELIVRALGEGQELTHLRRVLVQDAPGRLQPLFSPKVLHRLVAEQEARCDRFLAAADLPLVSILIPSAGRAVELEGCRQTHLGRCLASLRRTTHYANYEILVVDNGQLPAEAVRDIADHGAVRLSVRGPFNFSRNLNHAAHTARGGHLLFLNDDTEIITSHWIEELLRFSCQDGIGAVGAKLLFPNGTLQHVGIALGGAGPGHPYYGQPGDTAGYQGCCVEPRNWLAVTGACLMSSRAAFEAIGGFDEAFELNYNDVDYCLRLRDAGYRCVVNPRAELYHYETMRSDGRAPFRPDELARFQARWSRRFPYDPCYCAEPRW